MRAAASAQRMHGRLGARAPDSCDRPFVDGVISQRVQEREDQREAVGHEAKGVASSLGRLLC